MKLLILCVMVHGLSAEEPGQVLSIGHWKEQVVAPDFLLGDEEITGANRNSMYGEKRSYRPEGFAEQVKRIAGAEDVGLQPRLVTRSLCNCETQYDVRDLGEGHYPRYLTVSHCKSKACQSKFNSCRLLYYMVHVLSQRDLSGLNDDHDSDENRLQETPLPEALRHKWRLKPMSIAVACVPDRRN
ncbi:PREDICTED: prothoracicotropic hormone-like [Dinoponera quadriceps]|uniref:Prothoracicotropic hormone-like n=1 Tax=Dinoponera quadriceps TaxID=609295 RepID=A0A6P3XQS3_DINQU|nr:PREDICTED: prothoracicotropic hormone-like [Dinoponera quadriceps]